MSSVPVKKPFFLKLILAVTLLWVMSSSAALAQFVTVGDAVKISDNCYKVTEDQKDRYGILWGTDKIDLTKPFKLEFIIYLGNKNDNGADGIALVFHDDPRGMAATGNDGGGLGFGTIEPSRPNVIKPSVAIEFDTWDNGADKGDIPDDHTALIYNGNVMNPVVSPRRIDPNSADVENNRCHTYTITWDPATQVMQFLFDGAVRINHKDDIINKVFKGKTQVFYGFTGSTGGYSNEQTICVLGAGSEPVAENDKAETEQYTAVTIPVLNNDSHTTGADISLSRIVKQPKNGRAVVSGNTAVYTPWEWFSGTDVFTYEICDANSEQCYAKCTTAEVEVIVKCKNPPQVVPVRVVGNTTFCEGGGVVLQVPSVSETDYQWKRNGLPVGTNSSEIIVKESGIYTVDVITVCGTAPSTSVNVDVKPAPGLPVVADAGRCGPGKITLVGGGGNEGSYRWYELSTATVPLPGATSGTFTTSDLPVTKTFYVSLVSSDGCEGPRAAIQALIHPFPAANAGEDITIILGEETILRSSGGISYTWEPENGVSDPASATPTVKPELTTVYTLTVLNEFGCEATDEVTVYVEKELRIPNAISPNGDGTNDTWVILNIDTHPQARLEIYNRWGSKVYETVGYKNDWNGMYNGKLLPASAYYYVITLRDQRKLSGAISIVY